MEQEKSSSRKPILVEHFSPVESCARAGPKTYSCLAYATSAAPSPLLKPFSDVVKPSPAAVDHIFSEYEHFRGANADRAVFSHLRDELRKTVPVYSTSL